MAHIPDLELLREFPSLRTVVLYPIEHKYTTPLYTHPQRRLSNDEIIAVAKKCAITLNRSTVEVDFANAIMDKMMEKSNE